MIIMTVDDEPMIREIIRLELEEHDHHVLEAAGGDEALRMWQANPNIDLIITDIRMPKGSGYDLIQQLRQRGASQPIFVVTGYVDYAAEELTAIGVQAVLAKPIDFEQLMALVHQAPAAAAN